VSHSFLSFLVSHVCVPVCIYGLLEPEIIQSKRDGGVSVFLLFIFIFFLIDEIMVKTWKVWCIAGRDTAYFCVRRV